MSKINTIQLRLAVFVKVIFLRTAVDALRLLYENAKSEPAGWRRERREKKEKEKIAFPRSQASPGNAFIESLTQCLIANSSPNKPARE